MSKPSIPKGTRDFTPIEMSKRNYIFNTIQKVFKKYGFQPIETPAMENLSTLMGKYGEEGDKLLFKVLNSGDYLAGVDETLLAAKDSIKCTSQLSEKGLRYDLTVPFARFVVQHQHELSFPFKRYQIQPVWRADRPQKGRYREFYQCDVDVVGSDSLLNEVELIFLTQEVFSTLGLSVLVKLNNRKILAGIAEIIDAPEQIIAITIAIDKLDKIGLDKVKEELLQKGLSVSQLDKLTPILHLTGDNTDKIKALEEMLQSSEIGLKGVEEVKTVFSYIEKFALPFKVELDLTLARGLNYYTGAIFEVKSLDMPMGSISGGGRYDNLTGVFGLPNMSGVGVSFGAERIYDIMELLQKFPEESVETTQVLFVNFGDKEELHALGLVHQLRQDGISAELYPGQVKMKKQLSYADDKKIPYVALVGEQEIQQGVVTLKHMVGGLQEKVTLSELSSFFKK